MSSLSQLHLEFFRLINDLGKEYPFLNPVAYFFAEYMLYVLCLAMLAFWFTRSHKNRMMVISAVIAFLLAEILGKAAGLFYSHHQPFAVLPDVNQLIPHDVDNSFPSDHSLLFFSVCLSFLLVRKKAAWLWIGLATCVAVSRIWVGVHYPVDVATGALIGWLSAFVVNRTAPKLNVLNQLLAVYQKAENRLLPAKSKSSNY